MRGLQEARHRPSRRKIARQYDIYCCCRLDSIDEPLIDVVSKDANCAVDMGYVPGGWSVGDLRQPETKLGKNIATSIEAHVVHCVCLLRIARVWEPPRQCFPADMHICCYFFRGMLRQGLWVTTGHGVASARAMVVLNGYMPCHLPDGTNSAAMYTARLRGKHQRKTHGRARGGTANGKLHIRARGMTHSKALGPRQSLRRYPRQCLREKACGYTRSMAHTARPTPP